MHLGRPGVGGDSIAGKSQSVRVMHTYILLSDIVAMRGPGYDLLLYLHTPYIWTLLLYQRRQQHHTAVPTWYSSSMVQQYCSTAGVLPLLLFIVCRYIRKYQTCDTPSELDTLLLDSYSRYKEVC